MLRGVRGVIHDHLRYARQPANCVLIDLDLAQGRRKSIRFRQRYPTNRRPVRRAQQNYPPNGLGVCDELGVAVSSDRAGVDITSVRHN